MSDPGLERAVQRGSLASRCLDATAADLESVGADGGPAITEAIAFFAAESQRVQTVTEILTRLGVSESTQPTGETA
jgi:hypothetical protein